MVASCKPLGSKNHFCHFFFDIDLDFSAKCSNKSSANHIIFSQSFLEDYSKTTNLPCRISPCQASFLTKMGNVCVSKLSSRSR